MTAQEGVQPVGHRAADRQVAEQRANEQRVTASDWIAILGAFMAVLDIQIVNASLSDITGGIAASLDQASWIATAYLIAEIIEATVMAYSDCFFLIGVALLLSVLALFLIPKPRA